MADGPWHIDIRPWQSWSAFAGGTPTRLPDGTELGGGDIYQTPVNVNDSVSWDVPLTAGTWTFTMIHQCNTDRGIYTVRLDSTTVGTIDGYAAAKTVNSAGTITNIVVGSDAVYRLTLLMATKNASSTNFYYGLNHIALSRTA